MAHPATTAAASERSVQVAAGPVTVMGDQAMPEHARGAVLFAHGSGSSRHSSRNRFVAQQLQQAGLATLLMDLLTEEEEAIDLYTTHLRFDIGLLADRLVAATDWLTRDIHTAGLPVGYFGASTGAGAALLAATKRPDRIGVIVSRGGRPDLAGEALPAVRAATLLIVGGNDKAVIPLNQQALARLGSPVKRLEIVPGASHLFEEPGTLQQVAELAVEWFNRYLSAASPQKTG